MQQNIEAINNINALSSEMTSNIKQFNENNLSSNSIENNHVHENLNPNEMTEDDIYQKYITSLMNQKQTEESN